jgi:hypothetical protein
MHVPDQGAPKSRKHNRQQLSIERFDCWYLAELPRTGPTDAGALLAIFINKNDVNNQQDK